MIIALHVVSRAYEICIPLHHSQSQIFDVTDSKNVRCRFVRVSGAGGEGGLDGHTKAGDRRGR